MGLTLIAAFTPLHARIAPKTPSDVYAQAMLLKAEIDYLRKKAGIDGPFPEVQVDPNKYPRHVIQKALEILDKVNRYRLIHGYGAIAIPPYPSREITPQDVYEYVKRVTGEVRLFIHDEAFLASLKRQKFTGKRPSDVYKLLWSISLGFDDLLGIKGYTPNDVYALSEKIVKIVRFLRRSQNIYDNPPKREVTEQLYPNHALEGSVKFLQKVAESERNLWITPTDVPEVPHRVISPTEVYDSLQYDIAELQRVKYRLGLERYFQVEKPSTHRTFSDIVANLEYATELMPDFRVDRPLVQYPMESLRKTPSQVYSVTLVVLEKLKRLKALKGIRKEIVLPPYIEDLRPMHVYQKGIEAIEKALRLKEQMGFYPSHVPTSPFRPVTPTEVYELIVRLDAIVTMLLHKAGDARAQAYIYMVDRPEVHGKKPSDVYFNVWKISRMLDLISGSSYTPNETFAMAMRLQKKVELLAEYLGARKVLKTPLARVSGKTPKDVFEKTIQLHEAINRLQKRANITITDIRIPQESKITPNSVYNALRLNNADLNDLLIELGIDAEEAIDMGVRYRGKTPDDVYLLVERLCRVTEGFFDPENYGGSGLSHPKTERE